MITFNKGDFHLKQICTTLKAVLRTFRMANTYHIYGLSGTSSRPQVFITAPSIPKELTNLLLRSGMKINYRDGVNNEGAIIIGLRRDVRKSIPHSRALLKTIIFSLEGKLTIPDDFVITGLSATNSDNIPF